MAHARWLKSERVAWLLGAFFLGALAALAYWLVGWLGITILGLIGLIITTRLDLHGGHAVADSAHGSSAVPLLARQLKAKEQTPPEQRLAESEERAHRARSLYLVNTVLIAMTIFGLGLFVLHQLP